jgi:DNA helicase-2/ATP-dependent DNA helicase PcrA
MGADEALAHLRALKNQARNSRNEGVLLSTIHRTKGLEWQVVILPGLQEKYLPYSPRQAEDHRAFIESERRLLYVAMTRTRNQLHLLTRPGGSRPAMDADQAPSRFIGELCITLSESLGRYFDERSKGDVNGNEQHNAQQTLSLACALSPVSIRYAAREAIQLQSEYAGAEISTSTPLWAQARLSHAVFGNGSVIGEDESAFEVSFDSGRTLNFSKKSAHLYFSPTE